MQLKDQILGALFTGETLSGEALATRFGVTRAAVWKAIKTLRADGYHIEASTNKGYFLEMCERINKEALERLGCGIFSLEVYDEVTSTNDVAKKLAAEGRRNVCVLAEKQTEGRGRMGRSFFSPEGDGLYLSVVVDPQIIAEDSTLLTTFAAVCVAQAIEEATGGKTEIKWVNDVLMSGKKVCGILTEASVVFETRSFAYAVIGIGINVRKVPLPEEIAEVATDIESQVNDTVCRNYLTSFLLQKLSCYEQALKDRSFMEEYRKRLCVLGKELTVTRGKETFSAVAEDITPRGELIVRTEDGRVTLQSGEVSTKIKR